MRKAVGAMMLVLGALPAPAGALTVTLLSPFQAQQHEGEWVAVKGKAQVRPDPRIPGTDINLVDADGHVRFIGVIPLLNAYEFPNVQRLDGKTVILGGVVEFFEATPATQLTHPGQVRLAP